VKNQKGIKNRNFFLLISFLFLTSLLSIKTLKKVNIQDIRISGSALFSQNDVVNNSSLKFPTRLIFVKTNLLEKELKQNLSLKNVSVNRELFPFGLKVHINSRTPIAYGERILNDKKILGFIDKDGIFINKQNVNEKNLNKEMVCTNPDLIVDRGDQRELCAGSVAMVFEKMGGKVVYFGKPYPEVYNLSINNKGKKILSVGDNLNTDIKGANLLNYDSLIISNGIHKNEIKEKGIEATARSYEAICNYIQSELKW